MEKTWFLYLSAVAVVVSLAQHCFIPCLALNNNVPNYTTDQSALLAFKSHIVFNNPQHILANNWSSATSICNWIGVSCGKHHHRVTTLNLPDMGIGGTIPPHIGNLSFLSYFNITNNTFHGHLPSELARLHRLNVVDFGINNFDGGVPTWFGNLPKLQYLLLRNNSFNGPVPSSIGNISELEFLDLRYNLLEGSVPEEIGNLGKLKWLKMGSNYLSGSIPATIFNMSSLESIDFTTASFSGSLPEDICVFLPKLKYLSLSENEFEGQIPSNLGECTQLRSMSLSYNKFTGFIPKAIGNLTLLQTLYIGDNYYKGEIPQELGSLPRLETLAIEGSNLTGLLPSFIFNISSLKVLYLQTNNLFGSLPRDMCFHQHSLQLIHLAKNKLTGNIPREIVNCTLLSYFYLYENNLTEFGLEGLVSTNCDVYSYGILLMETFTRVKPTDEMFIEDMTMKRWMMESLPNSISRVIDANLLKPEKEQLTAIVVQCVSSIMELALSCCVQSPEERINMKDVLTTLKKVRLLYLANCERT